MRQIPDSFFEACWSAPESLPRNDGIANQVGHSHAFPLMRRFGSMVRCRASPSFGRACARASSVKRPKPGYRYRCFSAYQPCSTGARSAPSGHLAGNRGPMASLDMKATRVRGTTPITAPRARARRTWPPGSSSRLMRAPPTTPTGSRLPRSRPRRRLRA